MLHQPPPKLYWCTSHRRLATHTNNRGPCCDPKLSGILLPCHTVEYVLDQAEANRLSQGSAKDNLRLAAQLCIGFEPRTLEQIPVIYKRNAPQSYLAYDKPVQIKNDILACIDADSGQMQAEKCDTCNGTGLCSTLDGTQTHCSNCCGSGILRYVKSERLPHDPHHQTENPVG